MRALTSKNRSDRDHASLVYQVKHFFGLAWLSSSSKPLKRDNVEAMHRMSRQLATGKGMPKDRKKGIKM